MELKLERPIVFFDLETTGTNITRDRIVELSYIKVYPDGREEEKSRRLNPEMHIPEESTAVHHITDADVADAPTFRQVAKSLMEFRYHRAPFCRRPEYFPQDGAAHSCGCIPFLLRRRA